MGIEANIEICELFDTYGNLLTEKQQQIIKDYYYCNTSLSEIAEIYGVSRQAVGDIISRSVQSLHEYERRLGLVSKNGELIRELNALQDKESGAMQKEKIQRIIAKIKE